MRSILRIRTKPHGDPERAGEIIIEVVRSGNVVATIYGSNEGIHVVSEYARVNQPFFFESPPGAPSFVIPLLAADETCPWCKDTGKFLDDDIPCPACYGRRVDPA